MTALSTTSGAFAGLIIISTFLSAVFIYVGAKFAMIEKATLIRSFGAAIGSSVIGWGLTAVLYPVPLLGSCSGFIIGLVGAIGVIALVFNTTLARAFLVVVFHLFAQIVAFLLALLTFGAALHSYLTLPLPPT